MGHDGRFLGGIPGAPGEQQPVTTRQRFRANEQFAESRMARRVLGRRQHDLGVAGDFDDARAVFVIDEAEAPDLEVITMGDGDRRCGREAMCTPMEFDLMGVENHLWRLYRLRKWASRRRPDIAAVDVAQIEPMARLRIAGGNPGERTERKSTRLQSLMRSSYAVFCLKKKTKT